MPLVRTLGHAAVTAVRGTRVVVRSTRASGRWVSRRVRTVRDRGAAGELGMTRLLDLHAASCAGDTLITIGLAGTIFFAAPIGEARGKVALYLLVTMVPFALLAPVVGPLLDHFRHGRRYALATTMLGRAFLAWLISDYVHGFGLYPAAFGVLALSRAYGVARSAAVPRLLPARLGLSEAGARASVYGTIAGAVVVPIGILAIQIGPQWPLRIASVIFVIGMVFALRLPPRADSDPPETVPRLMQLPWKRPANAPKVLSGRLVVATVAGSAGLRALYGFLLLFLAFSIKAGDLPTRFLDVTLSAEASLGVVGGALAAGTFLATAIGTRLRIRRPVALQAGVLVVVAGVAMLSTLRFSLPMVAWLCLAAAIGSGLAKLAVDASIQERIPEQVRASAFAHAETLLMLAWVAGGAVGLIPFQGRFGVGLAVGFAILAAVRAVAVAGWLRKEQLRSGPADSSGTLSLTRTRSMSHPRRPRRRAAAKIPTATMPTAAMPASAIPTTAIPTTAIPTTAIPTSARPASPNPDSAFDDEALAPPGFHIYRPTAEKPSAQRPTEPTAGPER